MSRRLALGASALLGLAALLAFQMLNSRAQEAEGLRLAPLASVPAPPPQAAPAPAVQQGPPRKPDPADEPDAEIGIPIPQDPERQQQKRREILAWAKRTILGSYDRIGKKDPRWDQSARLVLNDIAAFLVHSPEQDVYIKFVFKNAKEAIGAGCTDPMVLYAYSKASRRSNRPDPEEFIRRSVEAANAMKGSAYPATWRAFALRDAARNISRQPDLGVREVEEATELHSAALALLPQIVEEDDHIPATDHEWYLIPQAAFSGYYQLGMDAREAFERVDAVMSKIPKLEVERLKIKGEFLIRYAWDARGDGVASTVTEEGWKLFRERLAEAREVLEKAWDLRPNDARTATALITVSMGDGAGREDMEKWFERAMKSDGDFVDACKSKILWLEPKWHGSAEELFEFGKACRATKNWGAGITLLYPFAVMRKIDIEQAGSGDEPKKPYDVPELKHKALKAYTTHLIRFPADNDVRSDLVGFSYLAGFTGVCRGEVEQLGQEAAGSSLFSQKYILAIQDAFRKQDEEIVAKKKEARVCPLVLAVMPPTSSRPTPGRRRRRTARRTARRARPATSPRSASSSG